MFTKGWFKKKRGDGEEQFKILKKKKMKMLMGDTDQDQSVLSSMTDLQAVIVEECEELKKNIDADENSEERMKLRDLGVVSCIQCHLQWLQEAHINEVIIVCRQPEVREKIEAEVTKYVQNSDYKMEIKITLQRPREGTADAIRCIRCHIKKDFIYLSMNAYTKIPPYKVMEVYRLYTPAVTVLLYDTRSLNTNNNSDENSSDFVIIDKEESRIYGIIPRYKGKEMMRVRYSLLEKVPRVTVLTTMRAARIYIFRHWVLDLVEKNEGITSVNYHLVNVLMQMQYRKSIKERFKVDKYIDLQQQDLLAIPEELSTTWDARFKKQITCLAVSDPEYVSAHIDTTATRKSVIATFPKTKRQKEVKGQRHLDSGETRAQTPSEEV